MDALRRFAVCTSAYEGTLPSGRHFSIPCWQVRFPPAEPDRLPPDVLAPTYTIKPLVVGPRGESVFGEIALAQWLREDGWSSVWVDTFHSRGRRRLFWQGMPTTSEPLNLGAAPAPWARYCEIIAERNGRIGGFFDVLAWRGSRVLFAEYKGPDDSPNKNEPARLDAAFAAGVQEDDMLYIAHGCPRPCHTP